MSNPGGGEASQFWTDLSVDLEDPAFLREYIRESVRIATIDGVVNELDEAREAAHLSKAELARAIGTDPAVIRRLFSAGHVNPTLGTLAEVATALGMRIFLQPLDASERERLTTPLLTGHSVDTRALAEYAGSLRDEGRTTTLA